MCMASPRRAPNSPRCLERVERRTSPYQLKNYATGAIGFYFELMQGGDHLE
jgi:hypothetical protein